MGEREGKIMDEYPNIKEMIGTSQLPNHIMIIPDGNRRWAREEGKNAIDGHKVGAQVLKDQLSDLNDLGIPFVTAWLFSYDNFKRKGAEVDALMKFLEKGLPEQLGPWMQERDVRMIHLGDKKVLSDSLQAVLERLEDETKDNRGQILSLGIAYNGRNQEKRMMEEVRKLPHDLELTDEVINSLRDGKGVVPPADLIIRTGDRKVQNRISDVGWLNGDGTEICLIDRYYPAITRKDTVDALVQFSQSVRTRGGDAAH
jgi:undecaprenyl diphosphate synthase